MLRSRPAALACFTLALTGLALALAACADDHVPVGELPDGSDTVVRAVPRTKLDVLFVVDNSISMTQEQDNLAARFDAFIAELELLPGGLPDLHLAVVSSDVGIGVNGSGGCGGAGDDGRFRLGQGDACAGIDGTYLSDAPAAGGRATNYSGTLTEAFGCVAQLGNQGCGFEQHLESMRRGLTRPDQAGFVRDDAVLAVVILADEDDCSASDPDALFDTSQDALDAEMGYFSSYRCFERGVVCDPDAPRAMPADGTPAPQAGCVPRDDDPYVARVADYADFLRGLKPNPLDLAVTVIAGDPEPVAIQHANIDDDTDLEHVLMPSCESAATGTAAPAVRLAAFAAEVGDFGQVGSICAGDVGPLLGASGQIVGHMMDSSCLQGELADGDRDVEGLQPTCEVDAVVGLGTDSEARSRIERCGSGRKPCWDVVPDSTFCAGQPSRLRLAVDADEAAVDPQVVYLARCETTR